MLKLTRRRIYFINDIPFSVTSFCAFSTEARKEKSEGMVHMRRRIFQGDPLKSVKRPFRVWCATYPPTMSHGRETPAINTSAKYLSMSQIRCQPQTFPLLVKPAESSLYRTLSATSSCTHSSVLQEAPSLASVSQQIRINNSQGR